eukprot:TRINITY_DN7781_c0_g1_i7.p2 TRINITY_DN7781_c0_g1~~TRINITY_DN7781_c0_g1_i7.p2  ORF type:complete len:114 (+),score=26.30 TRINITY_DN7781_c0_g1_i7:928-1269(+)
MSSGNSPFNLIERFIVWMRTSALPNFKKHWGVIEDGLELGEYQLTIKNLYDVSKFSGKKYIVITTTNKMGGKNYGLGGIFIGIAGMSMLLCAAFLVLYRMSRQKDPVIYAEKS